MKRSTYLYICDILDSIERIEKTKIKYSEKEFMSNQDILDATFRRLELIGEAIKNIPDSLKSQYAKVHWRGIAGFRDILVHGYFKVDNILVWKIINEDLNVFKKQIEKIKKNLDNKNK